VAIYNIRFSIFLEDGMNIIFGKEEHTIYLIIILRISFTPHRAIRASSA
jgi:hypothetical protein